MLLSMDNPEAQLYCVRDAAGQVIPFVHSFDTETCEIELAICVDAGRAALSSQPEEDTPVEMPSEGEIPEEILHKLKTAPKLLKQTTPSGKLGMVLIKFVLPGATASYLEKASPEEIN